MRGKRRDIGLKALMRYAQNQSAAQVRGILCELTGKPEGSMKKYGVFLKEIRLESLFPFRKRKDT
ncbi:MAG: hypothetical protein RDV48_16090 [Candidatus Eremiobacteraeota bacterium]|nr:hypothetical protein [Candidatus Eremiobacteraeota bacterium]